MKRSFLLPSVWLLDQIAGDPEWLPHPVRIMGLAITKGELALRHERHSNRRDLVSGAALTIGVVACSYYLARQAIRLANHQSPVLGDAVELLLGWTCLASRSLRQEAIAVITALEAGDLNLARTRLARIVGRDTHQLNISEVSRAVIETLAESACDGIISPLVYMAFGGVPLAMAYKAVNTLDSMIGHADERYLYFGKAAARLDDVANFVPARITALGIVACSMCIPETHSKPSWRVWRRDGFKHKSPNAGQPESAMAGALQVQLGGENSYDGEIFPAQRMGKEFGPPSASEARRAIQLVSAVTILATACSILFNIFFQGCNPKNSSLR